MDKETLRMQMLAGVITEGEYKAKLQENEEKESLNEHYVAGGIVGIGAINQIPSRAKADYEDAFEYFLSQKYTLNEEVTSNDMINFVEQNFDIIKNNFLKSETELIKDSAEDEEDEKDLMDYLNDSLNKATDASSLIDVINERSIGIDLSNPKEVEELFNEIKGYASLEEGKEVEEPTIYEDVIKGSNVKKVDGKYRVLSGKSGKMWPQKYDSKKDAEDAIKAYHAKK